MELQQVLEFIRPELLIIVAVCYCLGLFIKQAPNIQNWVIPFVLLVVSIVLCVLYMGLVIERSFDPDIILISIMQGVLCASISVFGNEVMKQMKKV